MKSEFNSLIVTIIPVLLTGFIGYMSWIRQEKRKKFYHELDRSIEKVLCPVFHAIRHIENENSAEKREKNLRVFFDKYSSEESNIHYILDFLFLNCYYETEEQFRIFLEKRDESYWENFWDKFIGLKRTVEDRYFEACGIQSAEYQWFVKLEKNNIFVRMFKEVIKILYDMIIAILILFGFLIYVYIYFKLTGILNLNFIDDYIGSIFMFMVITVVLFCILLVTNEYAVIKSTNSPKSDLNFILRKIFPRYFKWWDGLLKIKNKQKYNYPEMYKGDICK